MSRLSPDCSVTRYGEINDGRYAEVRESDLPEDDRRLARMAHAYGLKQFELAWVPINFYVPRGSGEYRTLDHVSEFTNTAGLLGICIGSGDNVEIWIDASQVPKQQVETIMHELGHARLKKQGLDHNERIVDSHAQRMAASIDWEEAHEAWLDVLVDPDHFAAKTKSSAPAAKKTSTAASRRRYTPPHSKKPAGAATRRLQTASVASKEPVTAESRSARLARAQAAMRAQHPGVMAALDAYRNVGRQVAGIRASKPCGMRCVDSKANACSCSGGKPCAAGHSARTALDLTKDDLNAAYRQEMNGTLCPQGFAGRSFVG